MIGPKSANQMGQNRASGIQILLATTPKVSVVAKRFVSLSELKFAPKRSLRIAMVQVERCNFAPKELSDSDESQRGRDKRKVIIIITIIIVLQNPLERFAAL